MTTTAADRPVSPFLRITAVLATVLLVCTAIALTVLGTVAVRNDAWLGARMLAGAVGAIATAVVLRRVAAGRRLSLVAQVVAVVGLIVAATGYSSMIAT